MTATGRRPLPDGADPADGCNVYTRIIVDEARRRGVDVEILDADRGELALTHGGRTLHTFESMSELTSAVALRRCDDKVLTRRLLDGHDVRLPAGRVADGGPGDAEFLRRHDEVVVKPARGEGGAGVTVGVTMASDLEEAVAEASRRCDTVLIEERCAGVDLRVLVIGDEVVAASVRRPPTVVGDGGRTVRELIEARNRTEGGRTGGTAVVPLDDITVGTVRRAGHSLDDVLADGGELTVREAANLHTGGSIHDATDELHPALAGAALTVARALRLPVVGVDLMVDAVDGPGHVVIEANEQPGLANHEPRPTAERFLDLLFPGSGDPADGG